MTRLGGKWHVVAAAFAGLIAASSAHAIWTFGGVDQGNATTSYAGTTDGGASVSLGISGAYAANGGTLTAGAIGTTITSGTTYGISGFASSGTTWTVGTTASTLKYYSGGNGVGMSSDSTNSQVPNHALDNGPSTDSNDKISGLGNTEAVLLSFGSSVVLSSIGIGYKFGDADISVFRYTGTSAPTLGVASYTGNGGNNMQSAGWSLVGNYGDLAVDTSNPYNMINGCTNPSGTTVTCSAASAGSSWWLITAYNSSYGAATSGTVNQGNDFFKIYAVAAATCTTSNQGCPGATTTSNAPEPGSLALVTLALGAVVGMHRRRGDPKLALAAA